MTEGSGSDGRGPLLGTAADVGRIGEAGLRAAAAVVEQVLGLSRQLTEVRFPAAKLGGPDGVAPDLGAATTGDRQRDLRTLRADAERLIELYGDWTRTLVDGLTALAEGGEQEAPDALLLGPVAPGSEATASLWLHTFEGPAAAPAVLHCTDLTSSSRAVLPGTAVSFDPPALSTSEAFTSLEIAVVLPVPAETTPGTYHGWLLAEGLPEITLAVQLVVA